MKSTIVDFISAGSGGGGGGTGGGGTGTEGALEFGAQTGDMLFAIICALIAICVIAASIIYFKKFRPNSKQVVGKHSASKIALSSRSVIVIGVTVAIALIAALGFAYGQKAFADANGQINASVSDRIYGHVDEDTGQVTFDTIEIKNNENMVMALRGLSFIKLDDVYDGNCMWTIKTDGKQIVDSQANSINTLLQKQIVLQPGESVTLELFCNMNAQHAINLIDKSVITISWDIIAGGVLTWDESTSNIDKVYDESDMTINNGDVVPAGSLVFVYVKNINTANCKFSVESTDVTPDTKDFAVYSSPGVKAASEFYMPKNDAEISAENTDKEFYATYDTSNNNTLSFFYDDSQSELNDVKIYNQSMFDFDYHSPDFWFSENWPYHDVREDVVNVVVDSSVQDFYGFKSLNGMFGCFEDLTEFSGIEYLKTDFVTDMSYTFYYIGVSNYDFNTIPNVSNWDTSNVVTMCSMFDDYASTYSDSISSVPNVSNWNTSKVKDFSYMFYSYAHGSTVLNAVPDVSKWNTSSAEDMTAMFGSYAGGSEALDKVPNVSMWQTGNVKTFEEMFSDYAWGSRSLDVVPEVVLWDVSSCTNFINMFYEYGPTSTALSKVPNVKDWTFGSDVQLDAIFSNYAPVSENLNAVPDVSEWNMEGVISIEDIFNSYNYDSENSILDKVPSIESWNVTSIKSLKSIFSKYGANSKNLSANINLTKWHPKSVQDVSFMFFEFANSSSNYSSVDLSSLSIAEGVNTTSIFKSSTINKFTIGSEWKANFRDLPDQLPFTWWIDSISGDRHTLSGINSMITYGQIWKPTTFTAETTNNDDLANVKDANDIYTPDPSVNFADKITLNFSVPEGYSFNYWVGKNEYSAQEYRKVDEGSDSQWSDTYFANRKFEPEYDKFNLDDDGKTLEYYFEEIRTAPSGDYPVFYKVTLTPNDPDMFLEWSLGNYVVEKETYNNPGHFADILSDSQTSLECSGDWSTDTYTVKFNANDFAGDPPNEITVNIGESITIPGGGTLYAEHKSFEHWSDKPGWDKEEEYYPGDIITPTKNMTLYANFVDDAVIHYSNFFHSGTPPEDQYKPKGKSIIIQGQGSLEPRKDWDEIRFLFWVDDQWYPSQGNRYMPGQEYKEDRSLDLVPYFLKAGDERTITFDANGAEGTAPAMIDTFKGDVVTIPGKGDLSKGSCDFLGWNTSADGSGDYYQSGDEIIVDESLTLYAIWGGILSGIVVDENNRGIGDVDVSLFNNKDELIAKTKTSSEPANAIGYYEFRLIEGTEGYIVFEKEGYFKGTEVFGPIEGSVSKNYTISQTQFNFVIQFVKEQPVNPEPGPEPDPGSNPFYIDGAQTGDAAGLSALILMLLIAISSVTIFGYRNYRKNHPIVHSANVAISEKPVTLVKGSAIALLVGMLVACSIGAFLISKSDIAMAKRLADNPNVVKVHVYDNGRIDIDDTYFTNISNEAVWAKDCQVSLLEGAKGYDILKDCRVVIEGLGGSLFDDLPSDSPVYVDNSVGKLDGGETSIFMTSIYDLDAETVRELDGTSVYSVTINFDYPE